MDLSGQVHADALPQNHFSGVTGMFDFILGTSMSAGGRSIIVIPARSIDGKTSRIIPKADGGSTVIPKGYVTYVVSEFGMVNLLGKNLSIVAVTGEIGFEKIIGLGMYALEHGAVAEVAFSTSKEWQGKGIAGVILEKLAEAARENGFTSLVAYMLPTNTGMIRLFKKLPCKVKSGFEGEIMVLRCDFDE